MIEQVGIKVGIIVTICVNLTMGNYYFYMYMYTHFAIALFKNEGLVM